MPYFRSLAEDATENFLYNFVREGDLVFDIGANIGQTALLAGALVGPTGRVISFEPNPAAFRGLTTAIQRSSLLNVTAESVALADTTGSVDFYIDTREEYTGVASSLCQLDDLVATGKSRATTVECSTLDLYCDRYGLRPNVLKLDVESAEPRVVAGGRRTIEALRPIMLFEFWETWWTRGFRELFEYLLPMYSLIRMQDGLNVEQHYYQNAGYKAVDILCLPR